MDGPGPLGLRLAYCVSTLMQLLMIGNAYIAALRFPRLSQEIGRSVGVCISPVVWLNRCCGFCARKVEAEAHCEESS